MCALRTGQLLNISDLARDSGISPTTAKDWLSVLEASFLLKFVPPYFENRLKRLVKQPKLYFLAAGLAAHIGGWRDAELARLGPLGGALFETHIFGELTRYFKHRGREAEISFLRTRDGDEIDFLVDDARSISPLEVKFGVPSGKELARLSRLRGERWREGTVLSLSQLCREKVALSEE